MMLPLGEMMAVALIVGGTDHIASEFHSLRLRLLEVLRYGVGFSVPRHIAGIGKQCGIFGGGNQFVAESVFVTDVVCDFCFSSAGRIAYRPPCGKSEGIFIIL